MLYDYDFVNQLISIPAGITTVVMQDLINDIRDIEYTTQGITYGSIATASGKEPLGNDIYIGITVELLDNWQIYFYPGQYIVTVGGGNLVGGPGGDPIAYSPGVQVLLLQSAASTVVLQSTGSGLSTTQDSNLSQALVAANNANTNALNALNQASLARKMQTNKAVVSDDGRNVLIYDDDGISILQVFNISSDQKQRIPA